MSDQKAPERHRDYFIREVQCGRRIVAEWSPEQRWGKWTHDHTVIDGFEFRTQEDANTFNLDAMTGTGGWFDDEITWESALGWAQDDPSDETLSVHEKFERSRQELANHLAEFETFATGAVHDINADVPQGAGDTDAHRGN